MRIYRNTQENAEAITHASVSVLTRVDASKKKEKAEQNASEETKSMR